MRQFDPSLFDSIDYSGMQACEQSYGKEFDGSKIKKAHFTKCFFNEVSFLGTSGASSSFEECVLKNCQIKNSCFDFSNFTKSDHSKADIAASSFAYTNFAKSNLDGITFRGCNFESSYFKNASLRNSNCWDCSFENAHFENSVFENIDLSRTNIDFSIMENVSFKNVKLPLVGILHSFGGLENAEKNSDNILFKFPASDVEITFSELVSKLEDIQAFFSKTNDFFTLSTINIYFGKHDLAYEYLKKGLRYSLAQKDFRMIGYYCKLASLNLFFTKKQLRNLYEGLKSDSIVQILTEHEYQAYSYELDRIKRMLIDSPFGLPEMKITLATDIHPEEVTVTAEMFSYLNEAIEEYAPQASDHMIFRHNSPYLIELILSDSAVVLGNLALAVLKGFLGATSAVMAVQKVYDGYYRTEGVKLDNKYKRLEIEEKERLLQKHPAHVHTRQNKKKFLPSTPLKRRVKSVNIMMHAKREASVPKQFRELTIMKED
ncbi:pentapeptide repeat-containing protein [Maridesulfovibrio hydrothermalis]|uniref:pentapeptide repeat-containing protein n=1 Tax=Maridesulfovibrio hydrothermalis TaxID=191026 RepID=UPI00030DB25C|nr:pentapeptide repeat-containing protein [Maridesulfovibrio hydrothermalis]